MSLAFKGRETTPGRTRRDPHL